MRRPSPPPAVVSVIEQVFGDRGRAWLAELPGLLDARCRDWGLEPSGEPLTGGTHSYVVRVRRADGSPAVLKLPVVDEENVAEAGGLYCYDGDGAVLLYEYHRPSGAMLLEEAAPGEPLVPQSRGPHVEGRPGNVDRVALACGIFRRLWRPWTAPADFPEPPTAVDLAARWRDELVPRARRLPNAPIPTRLLDRFAALADEYSTPDGPVGLANRDNHLGNIVSARRQPWLLIDPKPFLAERAFDAGFLLLIQVESLPDPAGLAAMVDRTAHGLGVDPDRARGWAFLRAMEDAVWGVVDDAPDFAALQLAVAERLA